MKLRKYLTNLFRVFDDHIITWPKHFESTVKGQEALQEILFIPIKLVFKVDTGISPGQTDIMNVDENARGKAG
jgi:hypothetical protein